MKKSLLVAATAAAAFSLPALAGEVTHTTTQDYTPPNPAIYGTGFYMGVQAGINAFQDFGGDREISIGGQDITIENGEEIGFVGGVKIGYVFGTGTVRPTIEADLYYNGVRGDLDVRGGNADIDGDASLHSGAFMGNFLLRFAFDRFQPYVGAGAGVWIAEVDDIEISVGDRDFDLGDAPGSNGFAWQIVGGADYYFSEKFSVFAEYKYLNYEDAGVQSDRIDQHLVVLGLRWHF